MGTMDALLHPMEDPFHQMGMENNKDQGDALDLEDPLENLTKAPTQNIPGSLANLSTKIEFALLLMPGIRPHAKGLSRTQQSFHKRTIQDLRSLRIIPTLTQDLMSNPHLQMNQANPHMATNYDQALGAIKDSLNTVNLLASLNL